jgi:hypothetical protein
MQIAVPALVAAAFGGWLAVPAAHAGFNVNVSAPITVGADQEYVLSAVNEGASGTFPGTGIPGTFPATNTGSDLSGVDATIIVNGGTDLVIQLADDDGDGIPDANVDGENPDDGSVQPGFGATAASGQAFTFIGVGSKTYVSGATSSFPLSKSTATGVYINGNVAGPPPLGTAGTAAIYQTTETSAATIDQNFTNGTVNALEVTASLTASFPKATTGLGVPFANIVVPAGATGTVYGSLGGDQGLASDYSVTFGAGVTVAPVTTLSVTNTAPSSGTMIGTIAMSGHNGSYVPMSIAVTGAAQTDGYLQVNGFTSGDEEIYALTVTGSTASTITDLNLALKTADPLAQAIAITPTIAGLFPGATIELDIPGSEGSNPAFLAYDLAGPGEAGLAITNIGVVPEPTGIGFLILGGLGLVARRRRAIQA